MIRTRSCARVARTFAVAIAAAVAAAAAAAAAAVAETELRLSAGEAAVQPAAAAVVGAAERGAPCCPRRRRCCRRRCRPRSPCRGFHTHQQVADVVDAQLVLGQGLDPTDGDVAFVELPGQVRPGAYLVKLALQGRVLERQGDRRRVLLRGRRHHHDVQPRHLPQEADGLRQAGPVELHRDDLLQLVAHHLGPPDSGSPAVARPDSRRSRFQHHVLPEDLARVVIVILRHDLLVVGLNFERLVAPVPGGVLVLTVSVYGRSPGACAGSAPEGRRGQRPRCRR